MPKEESQEVEEPPSVDSLQNQEGPTLPRNLNDIVLQARAFQNIAAEEKKQSNELENKTIW